MTITVLHTGTRAPRAPSGVRVLHAPMLDTHALPFVLPAHFEEIAIVVTSIHGVRALPEMRPVNVSWWAVGGKTARELQARLGANARIHMPAEDAQHVDGLVAAMAAAQELPQEVVVLGLRDTERALPERLMRARSDLRARHIDAYETLPNRALKLDALLQGEALDVILWTSPRGVRAFEKMTMEDETRARVMRARQVAIGPTTASAMARVDEVLPIPNVEAYLRELPQR